MCGIGLDLLFVFPSILCFCSLTLTVCPIKVFKCDSQEKQFSAQQHKKNKVSKSLEDIQITVSSNGNAAMMVSPPAIIASVVASPCQANMDSMIVSPQENIASMILCPQENVRFTPIKEYISVGKLPENPKEKKPAKQIEKKSTADLNIEGIKQKVYHRSILLSLIFILIPICI